MKWSRMHALAAGAGLIALTNAVALLGVMYNRAGTPEATLRLTQRELYVPYRWDGNRENSGMSLALTWRVLREPQDETQFNYYYATTNTGTPDWLDRDKMRSLGFDVSPQDASPRQHAWRSEKQLAREVLLVLELDGPAYRRSLEITTRFAAREEAKLPKLPDDKNLERQVKNAREALDRETNRNTRLFVVDAGLDAAALRASYPDASRYAIVYGKVRPGGDYRKPARVFGYVDSVNIDSIHVPFAFRAVFENAARSAYDNRSDTAAFEASVAFGKRLEPWIIGAQKK